MMKRCINCFRDSVIRNIIKSYGSRGNCDFCSSKDIEIFDISEPQNLISDKITSLIQIYTSSDCKDARPLKEILRDEWDIFSGGAEGINALVKALCSVELGEDNDVFTKNVSIDRLHDLEYIKEYSVIRGLTWKQFSEAIKYSNRFFSSNFNEDVFASFLSMAQKKYDVGTNFYRARITSNPKGFLCDEMYSPPIGKRNAGRVNPEGIGVLYLSTDEKTVLNETRVTAYDYVTIGEFKSKKALKVVNLSEISRISPFLYEEDFERYALNRQVFQEMASEIAKPVRRNDSPLEYLPTQYISEFVKSQGYDGVEFESTLKKGGINIALFDESLVECICVKTIEVINVEYVLKNPQS